MLRGTSTTERNCGKRLQTDGPFFREFFWHQICDVWIEEVKKELVGEAVGSIQRVELLS
jgi:valyl-tRNA synthetase